MNQFLIGRTYAAIAVMSGAIGLTVSLAQVPASKTKPSLIPVATRKAQKKAATVVKTNEDKKTAAIEAEKILFFENQVQPILQANCLRCHGGGEKASGKLRLTSREEVLKGGVSGPAIDLAKPGDSLLLKAINYVDDLEMPPAGKLPKTQIEVLTKWVEMGAPWKAQKAVAAKSDAQHGPPQVNAETMKFWSFQPVKLPKVPVVKNKTWARNPIDNFVLAKLEKSGLKPAPPADRIGLLRRATYDLIGLPPTPEDVKAFLADKSPQAYETVLDRLLASPQYGERWGRHWLDLVRYGETNSFERDDPKPFVWRYRDYIIRSLNEDKPYDQFIREQLAGDELPKATPDTLIATGYYRLGQWDDEPSDPLQARYDELDDIVATTSQAFLGMTVNCARCHDHKIDPISQKDYYKFLSFFQGTTRYGGSGRAVADNSLRSIAPPDEQLRHEKESLAYKGQLDSLNTLLTDIEKPLVEKFSPVEKEEFKSAQNRIPLLKKRVPETLSEDDFKLYTELTEKRDKMVKNPPKGLEQALAITEKGRVPDKTFLMLRGNPHVPGDEVQPGFLSVLAPPQPEIPNLGPEAKSSGRRLALANWIAAKSNPLTARVMANRIWQHHFGRGIVRSPNNFGFLGDKPTHPELLDWLAVEFMKGDWKLKPLHKTVMLSNAYRMSSKADAKALDKDPENNLFWRFDMRRLDAEEIRDSVLFVNKSLNLKGGGPSIYPTIPKEVLAGQSRPGSGWGKSTPEEMARRSVYIHIKRSLTVPLLASFDAADTDFTCPVRFATTQPTQALSMVNSAFTNEQASLLADYLKKQRPGHVKAQVMLGLSRVLQREPKVKEIERGLKMIQSFQRDHGASETQALKYFCIVLLNLNEFIYLD